MSRLHSRIAGQAANSRAAVSSFHPYGTPDTPVVMPMVHVRYAGGGIGIQQMQPLITSDGDPIYATAPGTYGQVVIAGGGRYS